MLRWHRLCAILLFPLLAYVVFTGVGIQTADMVALVSHAPETDPDMLMMRQHINGTDNYSVVSAPDYTAPTLPLNMDYAGAIQKAAALGRTAAPGAALRLVEIRNVEGQAAGHVQMDSRHLLFDLQTGRPLPSAELPPAPPGRNFPAPRASFKFFHRFNYLGPFGTALNLLAGAGLSVLLITGLVQYARLYKARFRMKQSSLFWRGGTAWRWLHRWISVAASILLTWIVITGLLLSLDNVGASIMRAQSGAGSSPNQGINPFDGDFSTPLQDSELAPMTQATLSAFRAQNPGTGIKVLRLRYFAGYSQGVVVAADADTRQLVFNTRTGARMSMSEKGYPPVGFPSGWEWHQKLKQMHRGDFLGMTGRWLDSLGALALLYMVISGAVMYAQLWARRARGGHREMVWK